MLMLANEIPVQLEVLDAQDNTLSSMTAMLRHLDSKGAILTLAADAPATCLHWGSRIRFSMEDGAQRYEISGAVIAHDRESEHGADAQSGEPQKEIWMRVWECHTAAQRRTTPRREVRFAVRYHPMNLDNPSLLPETEGAWQEGWCLDIGGGGMRMRAPLPASIPERLHLQFCLPTRPDTETDKPARLFRLMGRVVRAERCGRFRESIDMAIRFERLSVADGLAIAAFIE